MEEARKGHQVTFEDAWQLWEEVELATGASVAVALYRPRRLQGAGGVYRARVAITATRREGKADRARTEYVEIGGARGARTIPAALVRGLSSLAARLEEQEETARQLAAF